MPTRITVPPPSNDEQLRLWAESFADMHNVMSILIENGKLTLPGEAVDEITEAWNKSEESFRQLVDALTPGDVVNNVPKISYETIQNSELAGPTGKAKRNFLQRLRDNFFMYWYSSPQTSDKTEKASEAANQYLELGETVVASIPGYEKVVEILSTVRQLIGLRIRRRI